MSAATFCEGTRPNKTLSEQFALPPQENPRSGQVLSAKLLSELPVEDWFSSKALSQSSDVQ